MRLSSSSIDLGMSWALGDALHASLTVSNLSDFMPLRYEIRAPHGVEVDTRSGELLGRKKGEAESSRRVALTVRCEQWGHLLEQLTVTNLSASTADSKREESRTVILQHFCDPGILERADAAPVDAQASMQVMTQPDDAQGRMQCVRVDMGLNYVVPLYLDTILDPPTPPFPRLDSAERGGRSLYDSYRRSLAEPELGDERREGSAGGGGSSSRASYASSPLRDGPDAAGAPRKGSPFSGGKRHGGACLGRGEGAAFTDSLTGSRGGGGEQQGGRLSPLSVDGGRGAADGGGGEHLRAGEGAGGQSLYVRRKKLAGLAPVGFGGRDVSGGSPPPVSPMPHSPTLASDKALLAPAAKAAAPRGANQAAADVFSFSRSSSRGLERPVGDRCTLQSSSPTRHDRTAVLPGGGRAGGAAESERRMAAGGDGKEGDDDAQGKVADEDGNLEMLQRASCTQANGLHVTRVLLRNTSDRVVSAVPLSSLDLLVQVGKPPDLDAALYHRLWEAYMRKVCLPAPVGAAADAAASGKVGDDAAAADDVVWEGGGRAAVGGGGDGGLQGAAALVSPSEDRNLPDGSADAGQGLGAGGDARKTTAVGGWGRGEEEEEAALLRRRVGINARAVGDLFSVGPGERVEVFVAVLPGPGAISRSDLKTLQQGQRCTFCGPLLFECNGRKIYRLLLEGVWGMSAAAFEPSASPHALTPGALSADQASSQVTRKIDLGKVGHVNAWKAQDFGMDVLNSSEVPLRVRPVVERFTWTPSSFKGAGSAGAVGRHGAVGEHSEHGEQEQVPMEEQGCPHFIRFLPPGDQGTRLDAPPDSEAADGSGERASAADGLGEGEGGADHEYVVGPGEGGRIWGRFVPIMTGDSGVCRFVVGVHNVHNPANTLRYELFARIFAGKLLRFSGQRISTQAHAATAEIAAAAAATPTGAPKSGGTAGGSAGVAMVGGGGDEGVGSVGVGAMAGDEGFILVLPELTLPVAPDAKCAQTFTVTNTCDEPLELRALAEPAADLVDVISVDILSSSSSTHVHSFSLNPQQTMQIMLVCKGKESMFVVPQHLRNRSRVVLAHVSFISENFPREEVTVLGSFAQGNTLSASAERMTLTFPTDPSSWPYRLSSGGSGGGVGDAEWLRTRGGGAIGPHAQTAAFRLASNCAVQVPFVIEALLPAGVHEGRVIVDPPSGVIEAMSSVEVKLTVDVPVDHKGRFLTCQGPSSMQLVVRDTRLQHEPLDIAAAGTQKLSINLFQESFDTQTPKSRMQASADLPAISLRGCRMVYRADGEDEHDLDQVQGGMQGSPQVGSLYEMAAGKVNQHHNDGVVAYPLELEYVGKGGPQVKSGVSRAVAGVQKSPLQCTSDLLLTHTRHKHTHTSAVCGVHEQGRRVGSDQGGAQQGQAQRQGRHHHRRSDARDQPHRRLQLVHLH